MIPKMKKHLSPENGEGGGGGNESAAAVIAKAVSDAMGPMRDELKGMRDEVATLKSSKSATNHMDGVPTERAEGRSVHVKEVELPKGIRAVRVIKAQMLAKMRSMPVEAILKTQGYNAELECVSSELARVRALGQNVFADGGALVPTEYSTEIIQLLRNQTAVRRLGARTVPMGAALQIPSQASAAQAYWVGENQAVTPSQPTLGGIALAEKKLMALVPISNDLIRNASIAAEEFVRNDLVQVLALKEDYTAVFSKGGQFSPRGIESLTATANQYAATAVAPKAPTLQEVKIELAKAKGRLMSGNIPMARLGWIMSPRTWTYLYGITDGNGNSIYSGQLDAGNLAGSPFVVTNQLPENLGGTSDESRLIFGDFDQFIIGESMATEFEVFPNATYDSTGSGTIVSGISNDQSVVRAILKEDFALRYQSAFVVVAVRWGAP
jgi:HK97 family phage major capsid protein